MWWNTARSRCMIKLIMMKDVHRLKDTLMDNDELCLQTGWATSWKIWQKPKAKFTLVMHHLHIAYCSKIIMVHTAQKKNTIHQVTTMLSTSKNVPFPGHNHLLTTGADDPLHWLSPEHQRGWSLKWKLIQRILITHIYRILSINQI